MNILFAASEATPFAKSGGLGDVSGSLPPSLVCEDCNVFVFLPLYDVISADIRAKLEFITSIYVPVAWRTQYCGIYKLYERGVTWYFLDNEYYFKRGVLYGAYDDCERFAFFSRAILCASERLDLKPNIIHSNDWQTALIPIYLRTIYANNEFFRDTKTVFTIHNIEYQGVFGREVMENVLGIPKELFDNGTMRHDGDVNLLKSAILFADRVTTVSPTYAEEIKTEEYSFGLHSYLRDKSDWLTGIINGIGEEFSPKTDERIFKNYTDRSIKNKAENKLELQKLLNLPQSADIPLITMVTRLVSHKGLDLICEVMDRILEQDVQMIVLGSGEWHYEQFMRDKAWQYPSKLQVNIGFNADLAQKIYAAGDIFLMPSKSEPCGLAQMIAMKYGNLPLVRETGGLRDTVSPYNKYTNEGVGFSFAGYNSEEMLGVLNNALNLWRDDKTAWEKMMRRAMKKDFSWKVSAEKYLSLYREII